MNTMSVNESVPEMAAVSAALPTAAPASASSPQAAISEMAPPQLPSALCGLAAAGFGGVVGKVDVVSTAEEQRFRICEATIQKGWQSFVEVGLALAEIRDGRLYRNDFSSFEEYCERRWDFKRVKAHYLISAARICRRLSAASNLPQPERESQLRPLLALGPEHAELAWQYAVQLSCGRPVTALLVKRAIKNLELPVINVRKAQSQSRQSKRELKRIVAETLDELLGLITQKADHSRLLEKFETLHGQLQVLFKPEKRKNR